MQSWLPISCARPSRIFSHRLFQLHQSPASLRILPDVNFMHTGAIAKKFCSMYLKPCWGTRPSEEQQRSQLAKEQLLLDPAFLLMINISRWSRPINGRFATLFMYVIHVLKHLPQRPQPLNCANWEAESQAWNIRNYEGSEICCISKKWEEDKYLKLHNLQMVFHGRRNS